MKRGLMIIDRGSREREAEEVNYNLVRNYL